MEGKRGCTSGNGESELEYAREDEVALRVRGHRNKRNPYTDALGANVVGCEPCALRVCLGDPGVLRPGLIRGDRDNEQVAGVVGGDRLGRARVADIDIAEQDLIRGGRRG